MTAFQGEIAEEVIEVYKGFSNMFHEEREVEQ